MATPFTRDVPFGDAALAQLIPPMASSTYPTSPRTPDEPAAREIDVYQSTSRWTYDLIGKIAIDHSFDALSDYHGDGGDMFEKYERMQQLTAGCTDLRGNLGMMFPWLDRIWVSFVFASLIVGKLSEQPTENSRRVEAAMGPLHELARKKVEERKRELREGKESKDTRDLISLMRGWSSR